jgi:hypothetical protein
MLPCLREAAGMSASPIFLALLTLCPFDEPAPEAKADDLSEKWGKEQEAE